MTHDEHAAYRHEALIYAGEDDFVARTTRFLRDGVQAGEPALVVVAARKIALLRESLGGDAEGVAFADMADVGLNPARIIPAWRDFVSSNSRPGERLRGIGEPIFAERTADELVECQRHEALLNLAFQDAPGFWLLCPYDSETMPAEVIEEARRTHPYVTNGDSRVSERYYGLEAIAEPFAPPLPAPPGDAPDTRFDGESLGALRAFVRGRAQAAELSEAQREDLVLAVNELASNSVRHGGGTGTVCIWREGDAVVCDITDLGHLVDPMAGRVRPQPRQEGGYGVWLANQLCDLVQIRPFGGGTTIRIRLACR
jgi:anti-sigma regulatory factor (Ser/Thr protein kinase)